MLKGDKRDFQILDVLNFLPGLWCWGRTGLPQGPRGKAGRRQTDECTGPRVVPEVQAQSASREATVSNEAERASCPTAGAAAPQWRQPPAPARECIFQPP